MKLEADRSLTHRDVARLELFGIVILNVFPVEFGSFFPPPCPQERNSFTEPFPSQLPYRRGGPTFFCLSSAASSRS